MEYLYKLNNTINGIVWGPFMLTVLLCTGVYYTVKLRFFQIKGFRTWWKNTFLSLFGNNTKNNGSGLSPLSAVSAALAGAIGTGNIVGVAGAITLGGAGAIFWMWTAAFFGMGVIYAENYLGIIYRKKTETGYTGGPMYYIEKGLHCKWAAILFSVFCTLAAFGMGNMTQANSISGALKTGFGTDTAVSGIILTTLVGLIIFGGIGRIVSVTEKIVPFMAVIFFIASIIVLSINIKNIPCAFAKIFVQAFDLRSAAGGFMGYGMSRAFKYGISRGVFSNEAGLGTSPIVYSAAENDDPHIQGMWGIFQVFIDTIVMCTLMALCIICCGLDESGMNGIELSTAAFESVIGYSGRIFVSASIVLFAFATLISWCFYGEKSFEYLTGGRFTKIYRIVYMAAVFAGSIMSLDLVWEISDTFNGLMAVPNLAALILLRKKVK